jgi:hypothetical protein
MRNSGHIYIEESTGRKYAVSHRQEIKGKVILDRLDDNYEPMEEDGVKLRKILTDETYIDWASANRFVGFID